VEVYPRQYVRSTSKNLSAASVRLC